LAVLGGAKWVTTERCREDEDGDVELAVLYKYCSSSSSSASHASVPGNEIHMSGGGGRQTCPIDTPLKQQCTFAPPTTSTSATYDTNNSTW